MARMTTPTQRIVANAITTAKTIPAIALTPGNMLLSRPETIGPGDSIIYPEKGHVPC